jgi:hypothetical protein
MNPVLYGDLYSVPCNYNKTKKEMNDFQNWCKSCDLIAWRQNHGGVETRTCGGTVVEWMNRMNYISFDPRGTI